VGSNTTQLKMLAPDGKMRETDVADTEQVLRLVQTIPSPKAEPFKLWLARVNRYKSCFGNLCQERLFFRLDKPTAENY